MNNHNLVGKRYHLIQELGSGESNKTFLAEDLAMPNRPYCVVKQLEIGDSNKALWQEVKTRCAREVSIWQKLGANNLIPQLLAYFEEDNRLYLIQEYIQGENLAQRLQLSSTLSHEQVIELLKDSLSSLILLHQNGIIHRCIKPSNLIIRDRDRRFILIDFGILTTIIERFATQKDVTKPTSANFYYPPQIGINPTVRSDIYALGIVAIQSLTGMEPQQFPRDETTGKILWQQLMVASRLVNILDKMTSLDTEIAYTSAKQVLDDVEQIEGFYASNTINLTGERRSAQAPSFHGGVPLTNHSLLKAEQPTYISPPVDAIKSLTKRQIIRFKPIYFLVGLITVLVALASVELMFPTIRPLYYLNKGKKLLSDQPEVALENFQQATDLNPKYAEAWKKIGDSLYRLERFQAALVNYDRASRLKPDDAEIWRGRGEVLYQLERFEAAITAYNKALHLHPNDAYTLNRKGRALYKLERYEEALAIQDRALSIQPNYVQALNDRGVALIGLGKYYDALLSFNRAQAIEPLNPQLWQNKALALQYLNRPQEAFGVYREALEAYDRLILENPKNVTAIIDKGNVLSQLQKHQEALVAYEQAIKVNPDSHLAWLGKGNALFALHQYEEALKAFDRTLKLQPGSYITWHNRGSLLRDGLKNLPEAIASYERATEINPSFYHAWRDRGFALSQNQEHLKAIESFKKALSIKANDYRSWLGRGIALSSLMRTDEALAAFDRAAEIQPKDPYVWVNRGFALEQAQQYTPACDAYRKAIEINPGFSQAIQSMKRIGCRQP